MARLRLFLLGPFEVERDREPVTDLATAKVRALLAYLAIEAGYLEGQVRPHRREVLAGLLWPDWPERSARTNLRNALSILRKAIGDRDATPPYLLITRETIQFNTASDHWIDVAKFSDLIRAGQTDVARLEEALALYRGPFLEGFSVGDSPVYEDWALIVRERLQRQVLAAFQRLIEHHEGNGEYRRACEVAWRQVELAPWQEGAHRALMRTLALDGQRAAALAQYEACRRALREELDVEPGSETTRLYERIRDGELAPPRRAPRAPEMPPIPSSPARLPPQDSPSSPPTTQPSSLRPPSVPIEGGRRIVTTLFAGIAGAAALAARVDAEREIEILNHMLQVLSIEVYRYGGTVDHYRGDGLVAFFGLPAAHEDDPERAVLAALAMQDATEGYTAELAARKEIELSLRVAVSTGEAIVSRIGDDRQRRAETTMGRAVALAAQLEAACEPGTALVAEGTYRLVAPLFEWQMLKEVSIQGVSQQLSVYRPLRGKEIRDKGRGIAGLESPLVGRDAESRALQEAIDRLRAGVGGIVTVVGEAGIGKSRLVTETKLRELGITDGEGAPISLAGTYSGDLRGTRAVAQGPAPSAGLGWQEGRCLSYTTGVAYQLWLDMMHGLLGIAPDAPPATVRHAMQTWLRAMCPERYDDVYPYLGHMASLPLGEELEATLRGLGAQGLKAYIFRAVETLIESAARQRPQVLVGEDLHWADPTSLELLERLLNLTDRVPLLFICVLRPRMGHGCWRIVESAVRDYPHRHTDLRLAPLSKAESETLVGNLLHVEDLPPDVRERILDHAEGNPFYVEEILRSLMHDGMIAYDQATGCWRATRDVADIAIPDTLHGVLAARIDRLDPGARWVLQRASVIGRVFTYRLLSAIAADAPLSFGGEGSGVRGLDAHLVTLQRAQLVRERTRLPELEYTFKHHLTQEAAYAGLLQRKRRVCHRLVAEALEQSFPERVEEQLGLLAYHWERAGDAKRAVNYLRRAGEQAAERFANAEAADCFSRALDLTPADRLAERCTLLLGREGAYELQSMRKAQARDLAELERLAAALDDPQPQARVALRQAHYAMRLNDYGAALARAQSAVELAQAARDVDGQLMGYRLWMWTLTLQVNLEAARALGERALALAREAGARHMEGSLLRNLGMVLGNQGNYAQGRAYGEQALHILRELGDRKNEGRALVILALTYVEMGHYAQTEACYERALHIMREIGDPWGEGIALGGLGRAWTHQGGYVKARTYCERALRIFREVGDRFYECWALVDLARIARWQAEYDEARGYLDQVLHLARETGERGWNVWAFGLLGLVAHNTGDDRAAREYGEQALRLAQEVGYPHYEGYALTVLGHAHIGLGRPAEAADAYRQALALRRELGQHHLATEPLAGLARVALAQGRSLAALGHVDEILSYLEAHPALNGTDEPLRVYLTCYNVLCANQDPRAGHVLDAAYRLLLERAAQIEDERLCRSFLETIAAHREIMTAWEAEKSA
jgi:DNA-binding SARP family transcriptional activator/class 3 adenylate cyclase/tetratricopeptide (TPR) repeat protein